MIDLDYVSQLAETAGEAILDIYNTDFAVTTKEDRSPLTLADTRSHQILSEGLRRRYPDIPVLSEEGKAVPYAVRQHWERFWCVDPLDGTKEFVKRNGEFTVNVALIEGNSPKVGIIHIPVAKRTYVADVGEGCWEIFEGKRRALQVRPPAPEDTIRVVKSRSHPSPNMESLLAALPSHEVITRGSALKFCSVAAGEAEFYPRLGPTWEWDTAAGQAIVTAAGGIMVTLKGEPFTYNKENLLNGPYLVAASLAWLERTGILERAAAIDLS